MSSLVDSRWAPLSAREREKKFINPALSPPASNRSKSESPTRQKRKQHTLDDQVEDFAKFCNYLRRLKWRSTTLLFCHHRALNGETDNIICNANFPVNTDDGQANAADTMFKLDFFEYYVLLERVLVHLLGSCGTIINAEHGTYVPLSFSKTNIADASILGDGRVIHGYAHRFHANVLLALDQQTHPLHAILGVGAVRQYLGLAKEVRNKWKEADQAASLENVEDELVEIRKRYHEILENLKLDVMLATILSALDQAQMYVKNALEHAHLHNGQITLAWDTHHELEYDAMIIDDILD